MDSTSVIEATGQPVTQLNLGGFVRIPVVRQVILLVGIAASVAAGVAIISWSSAPGYSPLYADLDPADAVQVTEALRAANIDYKLDAANGAVLVPESSLHNARLELAAQGLPQSAAGGMGTLQGESSFGQSQHRENAILNHALEVELARTISSLATVRDARVHLALPKRSAFMREQKAASASVTLHLQRGGQLEEGQVAAVVHLVAASVPNLAAGKVTVIDQNGNLLNSGNEPYGDARISSHFKQERRLEKEYVRRIEELLTPLVGPGRVRAKVAADLDFTVVTEAREIYDPARTTKRSEHISEELRRGGSALAGGVPGALSNQPPVTSADAAAELADTGGESINQSKTSTTNYEPDRLIRHTQAQSGRIRRLSVAVLVDDSPLPGATAAEQRVLTDADVQRFTALVKESVGFSEVRGDTVVVVNAAFIPIPEVAAAEKAKFYEKPVLRDTTKLVLGAGLVLALAFGLVRPLLRGILANDAQVSAQYAGAGGTALLAAGSVQVPGAPAAIAAPKYEEKVAAAKNITGHDPARVAQVVAQWVSTDG